MSTNANQIGTNALSPASASADGVRADQHPLPGQIAADRYSAAKNARTNKRRGLMFNKLIPAGGMADDQGTANGTSSASFDQGLF